jgi:stress-induced morphogen
MKAPVESRIHAKLSEAFSPVHIVLENESHTHNVPKGSESHFKLVLVSSRFEGLSRIDRQRLVNEILKGEIAPGGLHALTMRTLTPIEWSEGGAVEVTSPPCLGGSKHDKA